jgi:hypothetical protein
MAKRARLVVDLCVEFVPILENEVTAWRASLCLLLQLLKSEKLFCTVKAHWVGAHDQ